MTDRPKSYVEELTAEHNRGYELGLVHGVERAAQQAEHFILGITEHFTDNGVRDRELRLALQTLVPGLLEIAERIRKGNPTT